MDGIQLRQFEKELVAHFLLQMRAEQERLFAVAVADWTTSGPLIQAYRTVMDW